MRALLVSACLFLFSECKYEKQPVSKVKEKELQTFVSETLKKFDSTVTIDTFRYVYLDTITSKEKYSGILSSIVDEMGIFNQKTERLVELMKTNARLASLSNGLSPSLYANYKSEVMDNKKEVERYSDEFKKLSIASDTLNALIARSDSIKPVAFYAACFYQLRHKDQSVNRDTFFVLLNNNLDIIKKDEFFSYQSYIKQD